MSLASQRRARLAAHPQLLRGIRRGIEKEGLRVDADGMLALTPHPASIGSALTNPYITTDYSEALLELITRPRADAAQLVQELSDIHAYIALRNPAEIIWNQSMPSRLPPEEDIPVATYGSSNTGMLKHVYRLGLAWRYGKLMQCIAGVHYNYSLPEQVWDLLADGSTAQERRNTGYMALIRNFMRHSWLLMYLFGASPAVSGSFMQHVGVGSQLERMGDDTWFLPWACSLRMSDLGYRSPVQSELELCYNDLDTFTARIHSAVNTPWPAFEAVGTHRNGERIQLNTSILQIENEYYSSIRPKQTTGRCERPNTTLRERGIQYVEVRCMDIDPWAPAGISMETSRFLDTFLLYCAIEPSPFFPAPGYCQESQDNFALVARQGRQPGLMLQHDGQAIGLQEWAGHIMSHLEPYARLLDAHSGDGLHGAALELQCSRVADPALTPSGLMLAAMRDSGQGFHAWTLEQSRKLHEAWLAQGLPDAVMAVFDQAVQDSFREQAELEAADTESFEEYVARFHAALA